MPKTNLGKWSLWLIVAMPILIAIGSSLTNSLYESVTSGNTIFEDIANRPALALSILGGLASGVIAFITGLVAILRQKERAFLVYASTVIGAGTLVFLIAEFSFPH